MKKKIIAEIPFWVLILIPILLLNIFWAELPDRVPLHYNLYGEADKWGNKINLWYLFTIVPIACYILLLAAKRIDPKKMLNQMGKKYYIIRFGLTLFLSAVFLIMLHALVNEVTDFPSYIFILISCIFIFLGNYFKNIRPNYFLGFRTPWALENEQVWKTTHSHSSFVWFVGGLIMLAINIWRPINLVWLFNTVIIIGLIIDPILYSFVKYNQLKNEKS